MANKKVKPCEDWTFLPIEVQKSEKYGVSEKNIIATLCYQYLSHSIYASKNDNWFYCSQKDIEDGSNLGHDSVNRILLKLILMKVIERKSGTNHRCTHYRLHQKIVELLPQNPETEMDDEEDSKPNRTLVVKTTNRNANRTLDKIRLDKTSQEKTSLIVSKGIEKNDDMGESFEEEFTQSSEVFDDKEFRDYWYNELDACKTIEELNSKFMQTINEAYPHRNEIKRDYLEDLQNKKNFMVLKLKKTSR